jgi:hypothetical protein
LKNEEGSCVVASGFDMGDCHAIDPENVLILEKETQIIIEMLQFLAEYDNYHRVIAIQIENEINMNGYVGGKEKILNYINKLSKAVKQYKYEIATRVNINALDMDKDIDALEFVEGQGCDTYNESVAVTRSVIAGSNNTKLKYIAENAAYSNTTSHIIAALANGGFYNIYKLDYDAVWNKPGVYNSDWQIWSVTEEVKNLNAALNKISSLIAQSPIDNMLEFNTETDEPLQDYNSKKDLRGRLVGIKSRDSAPVGLVIVDENYLYFVSDRNAFCTIDINPSESQSGYLDDNGKWITIENRVVEKIIDGEYQITINAGECIRVKV